MKLIYPKADIVIGVSNKLSKDLGMLIKKKVKTVYSPSYDKSIILKSRKQVSLSNKFQYIVNVSRFSERKDHQTTLKAFQIIKKKFKKIKLILVGYRPEHKNIIS